MLIIIGLFFVFSQISINGLNNRLQFKTNLTSPLSETNFADENYKTNDKKDVDKPKKLANPPDIIKAIYLTSWSASKKDYIDYLIDLVKTTEINAVVIDIKDFSGYVAYNADVPEVTKYNAKSIRIKDIDLLIEELHQEGIYVIARITIFQDPVLAQNRPDLAIHSKNKLSSSGSSLLSLSSLWFDNVGLAWIDPLAKEAWDYNIAISKDAVSRGFDELNFDYIRFPSDGNLKDMIFPFWDEAIPKHEIIKEFFKYLRQELPDEKLSIDLFGLSTVSSHDLGVGQIIEDAFEFFDYICPMIYPSHYADGFLGFQNPAEYPYEVVKYSIENALRRLLLFKKSQEKINIDTQLRPWIQDFNLGTTYDSKMVNLEIKAISDELKDNFFGFMVWNSRNVYTKEAFQPANQE